MKLRLTGPEAQVHEVQLTAELITIGRGVENDFVIPDPTVSRSHVSIRFDESSKEVHIEDGGSRYGVRLNGQVVRDSALFTPGDSLEVGSWTAEVYDEKVGFMSDGPTLDMEATRLETPSSTRKTRLLKVKRRRRYSTGYLVLLIALAITAGLMLTYVILDML